MNLVPRKVFLEEILDDFMPSTNATNMKCDIYEQDNKYFIEMDLPGYEKTDINIVADKEYLIIKVSKEQNNNEEQKNYIKKERCYNEMSRSFYIGSFDESEVKATFKNGILKIIIPKLEKEDFKKIIEIEE